ncbi:hypothetical protein TcCL_Unassigned05144, partial [Trypanosoma cruzi]
FQTVTVHILNERTLPKWMKRSLPWSAGDQQPVASVMKRWRKSLVHLEYPRWCFLRALPAGMLGNFGGSLRARRLLKRRWSHCGIRIRGPLKLSERQAEHVRHVPSYCGRTSADSAAGWSEGRQSAARWSARICGAHVGKKLRRRQRRAGLFSKKGTAPPTQRVTCDTKGTRRPVEEWAGVAPCLCAEPPLGARCPGQHQE